jgi:hypothetical protein
MTRFGCKGADIFCSFGEFGICSNFRAKIRNLSHYFRTNWLPISVVLALIAVSALLSFNGLYGQDAHEYLRLSRAYADLLHGHPYVPSGQGDAEFAVGYPFLGALLSAVAGNNILVMQMISWIAIGFALFQFDRLLRLLSPGARKQARWAYGLIALALSPYVMRAGLTVMSDAFGLALLLTALWFSFLQMEFGRLKDAVFAAFFIALCVVTRFSTGAFLLPVAIAVASNLFNRRQWFSMFAAALAAGVAFIPHFWLKAGVSQGLMGHSLMMDWSLLHTFQRTFTTVSGTIHYPFPNAVFVFLYPLCSPGFFPLLPLLFFLFMKTDWLLPVKKLLLISLSVHALFLLGLPSQNARYLIPDFITILLIMFPAWDRFFAYGFYFLKRHWMRSILTVGVLVQLISAFWILRPAVRRNRLEQTIVTGLQQQIPPDADLYAFDLDVAIKSYMPNLHIRNLWERRYDTFPDHSYILFNEPGLKEQWKGQNPMLNWENAKQHYQLKELKTFPEGWTLYEVLQDDL